MSDPAPQRIRVTCPHCGAKAKAPLEYAGRKVKCASKECGQSFQIPAAEAASPDKQPTPAAAKPTPKPKAAKPAPPKPAAKPAPPKPKATPPEDEGPLFDNDFLSELEREAPRPSTGVFQETVASNPGLIRFNPLQWWKYQPLGLIAGVGSAALVLLIWLGLVLSGHSGTLATKDGGATPIWLFSPAILGTLAYFTWNKSHKFRRGDANPGIVVSLEPALIAVPTDLSQGVGEYLAVKILPIKLKSSCGKPLEIGSVVPTIAYYGAPHNKHAEHWSDFYPDPAEYATGDQATLERLAASFPEEQYAFLHEALQLIERPYAPGLYALWEAPGKAIGRKINNKNDY
ncbi:DUF3239 domain-containing protein [Aeoliella mucimassa]|uniref:Uncharacterized protein n=1 Tax=Aeoliella mucimassa TaxID=2527972 RepID=A0A518AKZ5_9BACT|nr:DUF3239 domain-containing protein [Aeoliella mucimassa]QDU55403.1 hypothetical protein Pan181_15920 [Aeoliella mucimassa]